MPLKRRQTGEKNCFFPCFIGNSFKRKHIQHFHTEFRSGMQRDSSDDGFLCLTSQKLHKVFDSIMLDLCCSGGTKEKLIISCYTYLPCSHWCHSCEMEIIASRCHRMPRETAKTRDGNRNVTNRLSFKTPLNFRAVFVLLWHKSDVGAAQAREERILRQLCCWREHGAKQ